MSITLSAEQVVGGIITAAALLGALAYFIHIGRKVTAWLGAIAALVDHELNHNHGTSIKDDVHATALSVGELARTVDTLATDFESFRGDFYRHLAEGDPRTP